MRLIDADALIEKWEEEVKYIEVFDHRGMVYGAINDVKRQPTVEPQKWIPVTERLPEEDTDVLITEEDGCVDIARYDFNMWSEDPIVEWWNGEYRVYPVAWMPLPAPWKGGESDGS